MERRKFIVALGGMAGLSLLPLGCGSDKVLASGVSPSPTPSPTPAPLTPKDGENAIEAALLDTCARFGFDVLRSGSQTIYPVYGMSGGIASSSMAIMLHRGKGEPPSGYLDGEDLERPPQDGYKITNRGNGWAHVGVLWTKQQEYVNNIPAYITYVKQLFEEAAEALAHTV